MRGKQFRRRIQPSFTRRRRFRPPIAGKQVFKRKSGGRRAPDPPKAPAIIQFYNGIVETVHEGLAYLTLEARNGHRLQIEWDEAALARKGIGGRQPFIFKMIDEGNRLVYEFIPDRLRPLPDDLQREISDLMSHYRATGELDDDDE
jgi:hypothetical protein